MRLNRKHTNFIIGSVCCSAGMLGVVSFVLVNNRDSVGLPTAMEGSMLSEEEVASEQMVKDIPSNETALALAASTQPSGDIWEVCGFSEFPSDIAEALEYVRDLTLTEDCIAALEDHVLSINPYKSHPWNWSTLSNGYEFHLIVLEDPLTYDRIFNDPIGDLNKVIDALSRPECRLETSRDTTNSIFYTRNSVESRPQIDRDDEQLKDSCYAEAFTNYASFFNACYQQRAGYVLHIHRDDFTRYRSQPELVDHIWQTYLEARWVEEKCETFDAILELNAQIYPEQFQLLVDSYEQRLSPEARRGEEQIRNMKPELGRVLDEDAIYSSLLSLGARLGDEVASLTSKGQNATRYSGIFGKVLKTTSWRELSRQDKEPSAERLWHTLNVVVALERDDIKFDWNWLVRHVCSPVSKPSIISEDSKTLSNCRSAINDFRTSGYVPPKLIEDRPLSAKAFRKSISKYLPYITTQDESMRRTQILDKIEQVAIELEIYD